jgi:hypothetical protein
MRRSDLRPRVLAGFRPACERRSHERRSDTRARRRDCAHRCFRVISAAPRGAVARSLSTASARAPASVGVIASSRTRSRRTGWRHDRIRVSWPERPRYRKGDDAIAGSGPPAAPADDRSGRARRFVSRVRARPRRRDFDCGGPEPSPTSKTSSPGTGSPQRQPSGERVAEVHPHCGRGRAPQSWHARSRAPRRTQGVCLRFALTRSIRTHG